MKLLLDENLSDKIIAGISDLFPDCAHVKHVALARADDGSIAEWAKHHDFVIVSKDTDFFQRSIAFGSPPKFIWLRVGNCQTDVIIAFFVKNLTRGNGVNGGFSLNSALCSLCDLLSINVD